MKPFPTGPLEHDERVFNYRLSRVRRCVENAFGIHILAIWANIISGESVCRTGWMDSFYMSGHALLHLLNELKKMIKCETLPRILSFIIIVERKCNILFLSYDIEPV